MSMEKIVLWEAGTVPFVCCSERDENIERRFGVEYIRLINSLACSAVSDSQISHPTIFLLYKSENRYR